MSRTEINKGTLIPLERKVDEDFAKEMCSKEEPNLIGYDTWLEMFEDDYDYYYNGLIKINGEYYTVEWEIKGADPDDPDFSFTKINSDGTINFHTCHYNGGASFSEVVEDDLKKQKRMS